MKIHRVLSSLSAAGLMLAAAGVAHAAPGTFTVFDAIPQFGIYVTDPPNYTPPPGIVMLNNGTTFLARLTPSQRSMIGTDVAAQITYHAQCDNYDRLGSLFMIVKPAGAKPTIQDKPIELVRWITPFSDYWQGEYATRMFAPASLAPFAALLTDPRLDVWLGIKGGSNPYDGDPCTNRVTDPDFAAVGFKYTVALTSTLPAASGARGIAAPVPLADYTAVPIAGSARSRAAGAGSAIVIVSGHGSASGGDEYKHTNDTLTLNDEVVGRFSTQVNCASYRKYSPDGNPFIFFFNGTTNPRNWCPGALVPSYTFPVALRRNNTVSLDMDDPSVPAGSYYSTSITLVPN